jgi:hypothetical protein
LVFIRMEDSDILHQRLRNQQITGRGFPSPVAAVRAFGAMQAQEFAMACWAIGLRTPGTVEADILAAFDAGEIVRTHVLRPTWHFVAASDLRWILALSAPRVHAINAYQNRQLGMDAARLRRGAAVIEKAVAGGEALTRDELQTALARARLPLAGPALAYAVMFAELEGLICSGPRRGRKFTYMSVDKRVPASPPLSRDAALVTLAERYFGARGPATAQDFANWSGFTVRDAQAAVAGLDSAFERETPGERTLVFPRRTPSARRDAPAALLMPDYDEYGLAYRDRDAFRSTRLAPDFRPAFNRLIALDGRFIGSWRRTLAGKRVRLEMQLPEALPARARRAVDEAAARYCQFIGCERA